jgi:hypothetical protein
MRSAMELTFKIQCHVVNTHCVMWAASVDKAAGVGSPAHLVGAGLLEPNNWCSNHLHHVCATPCMPGDVCVLTALKCTSSAAAHTYACILEPDTAACALV